jgi:3-(3-hydroxy-phenyl)propionate hydroxylase
MHTPADQPRPSIYYDYKVYDSAPPPVHRSTVPALVVGAGPIGLVTALGLAQQGVRCVLIEAERQVSEGSRAIVFTRRSMEILQQAGISEAVQAMGLPWSAGNSFYRGQKVFRMQAPQSDHDRFAPMTNLQQQYLEELLVDAVNRQPLIELRWGHKVTAIVRNDAQGAELAIDTPHGPYTQAAQWVVAADGARSVLRQLCDLKLDGAAYEGKFVIADIQVDLPLPTERLAFFDPDWNRGNTVLMHREPHGIWRIDYQLPPDETPEQALAPASLSERINAQLAMIGHPGLPWELDWCSVYSARALTLPDYIHHRIALVGDAAHLLPIFGVRGANTGFQDAQNLAWKLGLVLRGLAGEALLASYSQERVAAAWEIIDEAGKSTRFMTPPTRGFRLLRDAVLSLSLTQDFVRPLYHWRTSRPHDYLRSTVNATDDDNAVLPQGPANGAPLPNLQLAPGNHLLDHLCSGQFTLLLPQGPVDAALQAAVQAWVAQGLPLQVLVGGSTALPDPQRLLPTHLGLQDAPGGARLVRPDQHLCARWLHCSPARLDAALRQALAQPES